MNGTGRRGLPGRVIVPLLALWLSGCVGVAVGAGAATGVAAYQERGIEGAAQDLKVEGRIMKLWLEHDSLPLVNVGIEVYEGRALLTGAVTRAEHRSEAVRLAWQADEVKDVLNEIQVVAENSVRDLARDSWITSQIKYKTTVDKQVLAINYVVETVNGIVYLIGIAQNTEELDRVKAHARNVSYVRQVISHVRVKKPRAKPS